MLRRYCVIGVGLFIPLHAAGQTSINLDRPYSALYDLSDPQVRSDEVKSLRSMIERARDEHTNTCKREEKTLRTQLNAARNDLKDLNKSSSRDDTITADSRSHLHTQISALEQVLLEKQRECKHTIPSTFEIQLSKVHLLERWPERRRQNVDEIEKGLARHRKHGDIDDIGYRKLADDQEKDITIGEQAMRQLSSSRFGAAEVQDPVVRRYFQELSAKIAKNSDLKVPLHVTVVDSPEINAAGFPGGFLVVTSGLLAACETESELAAVIAQQIAHIAARHGSRASKRSVIAKLFVPAAQITTGLFTGGVSSAGAYYGMDYGFQSIGMLVDRTLVGSNAKAQQEADQLGIQYAWKAGFDPKGFISFLETVAKRTDHSQTQRFLFTKPPLGERLIDAFTEIQFLPPKANYVVDSPDFQFVKESTLPSKSN